MASEVRFYYIVPSQVVRRRQRCPIAYLPVGALEWHGSHLPFGTDAMTDEHIAVAAAKKAGGVVFPPMVYGDCRYRLHDCRPEWVAAYRKEMKLNPRVRPMFLYGTKTADGISAAQEKKSPIPLTNDGQMEYLIRQIVYAMLEIALYGFRGIVLLPGHGPVTSACQAARWVFEKQFKRLEQLRPFPKVLMFAYIVELQAIEPALKKHWIHADKMESSLLQVIEPETVHPETLPKSRKTIPNAYLGGEYLDPATGYNPKYRDLWPSFDAMDPRNMNRTYGRKVFNFSVQKLAGVVRTMCKACR